MSLVNLIHSFILFCFVFFFPLYSGKATKKLHTTVSFNKELVWQLWAQERHECKFSRTGEKEDMSCVKVDNSFKIFEFINKWLRRVQNYTQVFSRLCILEKEGKPQGGSGEDMNIRPKELQNWKVLGSAKNEEQVFSEKKKCAT